MKKILYLVAFCCAISQILQASKLTDMVQRVTGQKMSVIKEFSLKQDSNIKFVVLKDDSTSQRVIVMTNKAESFVQPLVPQAFITENEIDSNTLLSEVGSVQNYNMTYKTSSEVKKAIATLPKDYIINLSGKNPKKTYYIVSDPMCPHCQVELDNIDKKLAAGNVKMIVVGWMGEESANKAAEIYKKARSLKSDSEKLALLKKVYNKSYKAPAAPESDKKVIQEVVRALMGKGKVEGTPYIIEEDN
ncbi:disulfide isomerase [Helicobacter saguini]|nr:disulfide isomerase [Helicobacter saguini]